MARRRTNKCVSIKHSKYMLLYCLLVIHFQSNFAESWANTTTAIPYTTSYNKEIVNPLATGSIALFVIPSAIVSNVLLISIWSYLNNVPLAKECLLCYLYTDFVTIWISLNSAWSMACVLYYTTNNYSKFGEIQAKVITFITWCLTLLLFLVINVISAIKCYMRKSILLDPHMPWGVDEGVALNIVRVTCGVITLGFSTTMFALGIYPTIYYSIIGEDTSVQYNQFKSLIFIGVLTLLQISCIITSLVGKMYDASSSPSIDKVISLQINNFVWVMLPVLLLISLCEASFQIAHNYPWEVVFGSTSMASAMIPAVVIVKSDQLQSYVIKIFKDILFEVFILNIYLTPAFLMIIIYTFIYLIL